MKIVMPQTSHMINVLSVAKMMNNNNCNNEKYSATPFTYD